MNNEVFNREEITLQDDTTVEIRPLVIFLKRKFLAAYTDYMKFLNEEIRKSTEDDEYQPDEEEMIKRQYDMYLKACSLALSKELRGDRTEKAFLSYLEEVLDDPTIFKIFRVCGGIDLEANSPN